MARVSAASNEKQFLVDARGGFLKTCNGAGSQPLVLLGKFEARLHPRIAGFSIAELTDLQTYTGFFCSKFPVFCSNLL
jgi:hypothetical protein